MLILQLLLQRFVLSFYVSINFISLTGQFDREQYFWGIVPNFNQSKPKEDRFRTFDRLGTLLYSMVHQIYTFQATLSRKIKVYPLLQKSLELLGTTDFKQQIIFITCSQLRSNPSKIGLFSNTSILFCTFHFSSWKKKSNLTIEPQIFVNQQIYIVFNFLGDPKYPSLSSIGGLFQKNALIQPYQIRQLLKKLKVGTLVMKLRTLLDYRLLGQMISLSAVTRWNSIIDKILQPKSLRKR